MNDLFNLNPKVSTALAVLIAYILMDDLTANEQNVLGNWLMLISQTIITNSASQGIIERRVQGNIYNINSREVKCLYNPLFFDINKLREVLKEVYPEEMERILNGLSGKINSVSDYINHLHN